MDELIKAINKYPNGTKLIIKWQNNLEIEGEIDTIFETDNGLDMDDDDYQEFYSCVFGVSNILGSPSERLDFEVGSLIEISMQNPPLEIKLYDGGVIWREAN
ncbi:hypothetical protein [Anaeropeptidivorans aminofermentans]|uniref:hypothetical protein n=1 Tax=Anaeropeptidivorans aminofermentans TaxID=2934315 RepID=UPI002024E490|nr:hypothetical protein [Anaeropeptidivorans aminofermentans]